MFDRFTDRARKIMGFARQEADRLGHDYIGSEHILLGLVKEGSGVAANVLENLDVDLEKVRTEVESEVKRGPGSPKGQVPFSPRAKKVLEYAMEEARGLDHNYVGSEHLLLGLLRDEEGVACRVLKSLGVIVEDVRQEVMELLGVESERPDDPQPSYGLKIPEPRRRPMRSEWAPYYIPALDDTNPAMRLAAIEILSGIENNDVFEAFLDRLNRPDYPDKYAILIALGFFQPRRKEVIPILVPYLRAPDAKTRRAANAALVLISGRSFEFDPEADEEAIEATARKWEQWWKDNAKTFEPPDIGG